MPTLPDEVTTSLTVQAIYKKYEEKIETPRRYLGASQLGKCSRALWYTFRWCGSEKFAGRMLRLFETGFREEGRIVANLRSIGCEVSEKDEKGEQYGVSAIGGHFKGHMDGVVLGVPEATRTWHLLEMKTHNHKSFVAVRNSGVKHSKESHYQQMQTYMHLAELTRALYFAANKNDDEIYTERINYNKEEATNYLAEAEKIIRSATPPQKIGTPDKWPCNYCHHSARCHGTPEGNAVQVDITCRSCCHATPIIDSSDKGAWHCDLHAHDLTDVQQAKGCDSHLLVPDLVTFASVVDSDGENIDYRSDDGTEWRQGPKGILSIPLTRLTIKGLAAKEKTRKSETFTEADIPF